MSPPVYGRSLRGLGVNLLVRETARTVAFARDVLGLTIVYADPDLAVLRHGEHEWMAHADHTYDAHALLPRTRIAALRGGGIELRVHDVDPDAAVAAASRHGYEVLDAAEQQAARPARGLHPRCRRLRLGPGLPSLSKWARRLSAARDFGGDHLACSCAWAAIRSTSPTRAPRARTRRRPRAASTRLRARRPTRRSTTSPRRSSPATSTAACSRSRTRSPASCPTRSRSSRRAPSRSSPRSRCTSRTASSDPPARRSRRVRVVHSHPMALAQCRGALNGRYERVAASTTSEAARTVAALGDVTVAAIASPLAAQTLRPRDPRRGDLRPPREPHALRRAGALHAPRPRRAHATGTPALRLITKHEPGALHDAIEPLRYHGVQMTSLHSRPIMGEPWRYQFYVDVEGHRSAPRVLRALQRRGRAERRAARARLVSREPRSAVSAVAAAAPRGLDRRGLGVLSFGHLSVDLAQGTVPALLPFLVADRGYSYAAVGRAAALLEHRLVVPAAAARARSPIASAPSWMMPVGTLLAAIGIALVGPVRVATLATGGVLVIASIGVAMYHPEAVRFASYVSAAGGRQGTGMSMFAVGGLSGWALGPILATPIVGRRRACAARRSWRSCRSPRRCSLLVNLRYLEGFRPSAEAHHVGARALAPSDWRGFSVAADRGHAAHGLALRASRRSCRSTSGARSTRARAPATSRSPRCWPPARFGTLARRPPLGRSTASAASSSCSLFAAAPLALLIPVAAAARADPGDRAASASSAR